jgi:hypothetical protein
MKRTVVFFKSVNSQDLIFAWVLSETDSVEQWQERKLAGDILICSREIDIPETDTREAEIEALEKQLENERAESHRRIATIQDRISNLRALTFEGGAA